MKVTWSVDGEDMIFSGQGIDRVSIPKLKVDHPVTIAAMLQGWNLLTLEEQLELVAELDRVSLDRQQAR